MKIIKKIKVDISVYIVILLFLFSGLKDLVFNLLIILFVHELGHIFFCLIFKVNIQSIKLYPFGGLIKLDKKINDYWYIDFFISMGGIIFQIIFGLINAFLFKYELINKFNLVFLKMNLLPIIPLDGNKILFMILCSYFSYFYSIIIDSVLSFVVILILISIHFSNVALLIFSFACLLSDLKNIMLSMHRFFLERYFGNFVFKKIKYYKHNCIYLMQKNIFGYYYENRYISEQEMLSKKFDISSYF